MRRDQGLASGDILLFFILLFVLVQIVLLLKPHCLISDHLAIDSLAKFKFDLLCRLLLTAMRGLEGTGRLLMFGRLRLIIVILDRGVRLSLLLVRILP